MSKVLRELNKWQFYFNVYRDYAYADPAGWKRFDLFIGKLTSFPEEGVVITKKNYKGIWIKFKFWIPFERAV